MDTVFWLAFQRSFIVGFALGVVYWVHRANNDYARQEKGGTNAARPATPLASPPSDIPGINWWEIH